MKRITTKIGDVFSVPLDDSSKKYFQYVANDLTQLNSSVIRAFKANYPIDSSPDVLEVVTGEVDFYAHVVLRWGVKMELWRKVGNVPFSGQLPVLFRGSNDDGNLSIRLSRNWYVWRIGEETRHVGELVGDYRKAEIGSVVPAPSVVHRMRTGEYDFAYPKFE
jgi:hypothetical protein